MLKSEADITQTERLGGSIHHLTIKAERISALVRPGQFVQIRIGTGTDPFLRRTFSICNADPAAGTVELLVDSVGRGTELLCAMDCDSRIDLIGPLGTPFNLELSGNNRCILVAGGIGAAPLLFAARTLGKMDYRPFEFIIGGRSAAALSFLDALSTGLPLHMATDDGSLGFSGTASELLLERLKTDEKPAVIYCCGPHPMMKAIAAISADHSIRCQISTEERMACGIGACLGCAVRMANGEMKRSCVDGPVFDAAEVAW